MDLNDFYPSPADLVAHETAVLRFLMDNPYIKEKHPDFAKDAGVYYGRNRASDGTFEFSSYFDIQHASVRGVAITRSRQERIKPNVRLIVSVLIARLQDGSFGNISYCLSVCRIRARARYTVLRKFHFDVTVATTTTSGTRLQEHPRCHLQYCGEMTPYMAEMGISDAQLDQMHPWLSEPRLFFWPMSLALLIDMVLHEFPDRRSAQFRGTDDWRGIVRRQERTILRPFYEKCVEVIKDTKKSNRTLAEEFYVG